jgi:uncharacterized protein involved in exopolysaccharide biosynthesis
MNELVSQLRRQFLLIACVWLVIVLGGVAWVLLTPDTYRSEGKLLVRLGRENVTVDPTANLGQGPLSMVPQSRENELNSVLETLKSRLLIEKLVDTLTPAAILKSEQSTIDQLRNAILPSKQTPRARAITKLTKMIDVAALRKSNLIAITCDSQSPELAQAANTKFIDYFLEHHRTVNRYPGARSFFTQQSELIAKQLKETEEELLRIKNESGITSVAEQRKLLLERQNALEKESLAVEADRLATSAEIAVLEAQQRRLPQRIKLEETVGHPNMAADNIRDNLYSLELLEAKLGSELTDEHFRLRQVREQLAGAKRIYEQTQATRSQTREGLNTAYSQAELAVLAKQAELETLKSREQAMRPQLDQTRRDLTKLNQAEIAITRLERDRELQQVNYAKYAQSLEQTRIDEALDLERISNIGVVQPPTTDSAPIKPDRPLLLAIVTIFATFASLGCGVLAATLQSSPTEPIAT